MPHRPLTIALLLTPLTALSQVYRCETPQGLVFSDERCGEQAELVQFEEDSSGVSIDPPEEVSEYLAQARKKRKEAREAYRELLAASPPPMIYPEPYPAYYPVYHRPVFGPPFHPLPPVRPPRPEPPPRPAPPSTLDPNR